MPKVEGRGQKPAHRQRKSQCKEHKSHAAGGTGHAEAQEKQQPKAKARERGENNNRRCWMHQFDPSDEVPLD